MVNTVFTGAASTSDTPVPMVPGSRTYLSLWHVVALAAAMVVGLPEEASAQLHAPLGEPSSSELAEARARYQAGNAAADAGDFADALDDFVRAFELSGNPAALYNAARTLRSLGRHVDARDAFDQLLHDFPDVSSATRTEATALRDEEATRVATLRLLELPDPTPALVLRIDGTVRLDGGARPFVLEVDPGRHGVVVTLEHFRPFAWEGEIMPGGAEALTVHLEPEPTSGRSVFEEPALWIVTGLVLVAAGAAIGGYFAWDSAQLRPESPDVIRL
jgi:tetratricopeptide (TPR) repeat protein